MSANFITSLFSSPEDVSSVAILYIPEDAAYFRRLNSHPIWEWNAKYAKEEGVHPIICTGNREMQVEAISHGYDTILCNEKEEAVEKVFSYYSPEIFFLLHPGVISHPRGLLRAMQKEYISSERIASLSAPGVEVYDSYVWRRTHQLIRYVAHKEIPLSLICGIDMISPPLFAEVEKSYQNGERKFYDPWFIPQKIGVVTNDGKKVNVKDCDFRVYVKRNDEQQEKIDGEWDLILPHEDFFLSSSSGLSLFSQVLGSLYLLYPSSQFFYSEGPSYQIFHGGEMGYNSSRSYATIAEKCFWTQVKENQNFHSLAETSDATEYTTLLPLFPKEGEKLDYTVFRVLHVMHPRWCARLVINRHTLRGHKLPSREAFTAAFEGNGVKVDWDDWGVEKFTQREGTNLWIKE